ncbi:hypothetical protein ACH42_00080 [Endozoicomonas sp. (ex Bugula neritina AB1)]|nr:hypothetical protein ACH42_00080 [Endozoicomonas sp. (ex Bugula neritina AB1)]
MSSPNKQPLCLALKLPLHQLKAVDKLSVCRTSALGGHSQYCENNHLVGVWYNSCKHRACPQCRAMAGEEWLLNTQRRLLDCPHHHIIFTLPSDLNVLWQHNRRIMTDILYTAAQGTLKKFAQDKRYLGATPGIMSVLHTWGRNLSLHPHLHVLFSHGGLDASGQWVEPVKDILFPRKPVMQVFRAMVLKSIRQALSSKSWQFPKCLGEEQTVRILNRLKRPEWVVHFCKRYDYAGGVAKYLSRYVKSGPLRNAQIIKIHNHQVSFRFKSHRSGQLDILRMREGDFIKRVLEHVPEPGRPSVRYCGLYNSGCVDRLNAAREQLGQPRVSERIKVDWAEYLADRNGLPQCAVCQSAVISRLPLENISSS